VWLHDDVCTTALAGPFDVVVDRATLHTLPESRWRAWAASIQTLAGGVVIVKAHRDASATTTGWSGRSIAALLPDFEVLADDESTLPHPRDMHTVPAVLIALKKTAI